MKFRRFVRTPKGLLLVVLAILMAVAAAGEGITLVAPGVVVAVGTAALIDAPMLRWRHPRWVFPDGAILTALIVAMILSPQEPWYVVAVTTAIAIASKYLMRSGKANVFNPAAFGLVATFYLFHTGQSWWGALPEVSPVGLAILLASGLFIAQRVKKLPVVVTFLGSYFLLLTIASFLGAPARVAELFRAPDLNAALFFAFFMVSDPPTSPPGDRDQIVYAMITAVASFAIFELIGAAYYLLGGLLIANIWEGVRRYGLRRAIISSTL